MRNILEINPRPTTSLVWSLPAVTGGAPVRAWLEAFRPAHRDDEVLESLFGIVHSQNAVVFDAAGEFAGFLESVDP